MTIEIPKEDTGRILLVIKGNKEQAFNAANKRKIPIVFKQEVHSERLNAYVETLAYTNAKHSEIQKWFMEDLNSNPPYSIGSLLFYQSFDN